MSERHYPMNPQQLPSTWSPVPADAAAGTKLDDGKPRWDLLPHVSVAQVVAVLSFGAKKYAPDNWRTVQGWRWRYYAAAWRHAVAWWLGERHDPESGLHHLAHAACCMLFLLELDMTDGGAR